MTRQAALAGRRARRMLSPSGAGAVGGEGEFLLRDAVFFDGGLEFARELERGELRREGAEKGEAIDDGLHLLVRVGDVEAVQTEVGEADGAVAEREVEVAARSRWRRGRARSRGFRG